MSFVLVILSLVILIGNCLILIAAFIEWVAKEWWGKPETVRFIPLSKVVFDEFINFLNAGSTPIIISAVLAAWIEARNDIAKRLLEMAERMRMFRNPLPFFGKGELHGRGVQADTEGPLWHEFSASNKPDESVATKSATRKPRASKPTAKKRTKKKPAAGSSG